MDLEEYLGVKLSSVKYHAILRTLKEVNEDPQIFEVDTEEGILLYVRFFKGELVCLEKWNGEYVCSGFPFLHKHLSKIPIDQIDFYLEMYSRHTIKFI